MWEAMIEIAFATEMESSLQLRTMEALLIPLTGSTGLPRRWEVIGGMVFATEMKSLL